MQQNVQSALWFCHFIYTMAALLCEMQQRACFHLIFQSVLIDPIKRGRRKVQVRMRARRILDGLLKPHSEVV